jgi:hypothetical protein
MFSRAATAAEKTPAKKTGPPREVRFFIRTYLLSRHASGRFFPFFFIKNYYLLTFYLAKYIRPHIRFYIVIFRVAPTLFGP